MGTTGWRPICASKASVHRLIDNAFAEIADLKRAQQLTEGFEIRRLHGKLDQFARTHCPIHRDFGIQYQWSVDRCEHAPTSCSGGSLRWQWQPSSGKDILAAGLKLRKLVIPQLAYDRVA